MTREKALTPSEFCAVVEDYAQSPIEDERYLRRCYEAQLVDARRDTREPLSPPEFVAAVVNNAGVDVAEHDRSRLIEAYREQLRNVRRLAGDSRV